MDRTTLIRVASLYLPLALASLPWIYRQPNKRQAGGILLGILWTLPALLIVHRVAARAGWWSFADIPGRFHGIPLDLLLGWMLLWGGIPALLAPRAGVGFIMVGLFGLDLLTMPLLEPVLVLRPMWWIGDLLAVLFVAGPAFLLARWTGENRRLPGRALLQCALFTLIVLWLIPDIILSRIGGNWGPIVHRPGWLTSLWLQLLAAPALLGVMALHEFVFRGKGTPVPFDPPIKLVRSGPYAYVANPMQLSIVLLLAGVGVMVMSPWIVLAAGMGFIYSAGLARWDEGADLRTRFGEDWVAYRARVRTWRPHWRPYRDGPNARLYVAMECGKCSEVGWFLQKRKPWGLDIVAAERHPERDLTRMTYDPADGGPEEEGVAAFARALEHINLGWAVLGWAIRFPLVRPLAQLLADVSGMGPMRVRRTAITSVCEQEPVSTSPA